MPNGLWQSEYQRSYKWTFPTKTLVDIAQFAEKEIQVDAVAHEPAPADKHVHVQVPEAVEKPVHAEAVEKPAHVEKTEQQPVQKPASDKKPVGKTPAILPYGAGNITPAVDSLYMKSFNSKVPASEQYANILNRAKRIVDFDEQRKQRELKSRKGEPEPEPVKPGDIVAGKQSGDAALQQYIKAKELVEKVYGRFKSEYKRQFLDWTSTLHVDDEPVVVPVTLVSTQPVQATSVVATQSTQAPATTTFTTVATTTEPLVPTQATTTQTTQPVQTTQATVLVKPIKIMDEMKAAGIVESAEKRGKKHFPTTKDSIQEQLEEMEQQLLKSFVEEDHVEMPKKQKEHVPVLNFAIEHPSTLELVNQTLEKTKKRYFKLKK